MSIEVKERNIHNRSLANSTIEYVTYITEMFLLMVTDMEASAALIEGFLLDLADDYKIEQINVICDKRNNTARRISAGKFTLDVYFKHRSCFNVTHLSFTIKV